MKFTKRLISSTLAVSMLLACWSPIPAKAATDEREVDSEASFMAALNDPSVSKITIVRDFTFTRPSGDEPLIIPEHNGTLVITANQGVEMSLFHAGIILGGDTTFENMTLTFTNSVRNAIIANGHTLTLDGVSPARTSTWGIHLFCGEVSNYSGTNPLPSSGNHGKIILRGSNKVGDIFAGSLSDVGSQSADQPNSFDQPATILVEQEAKGEVGTIYGCGAREDRSGGHGNDWLVDAQQYQSNDKVTIDLSSSIARRIEGDTGTLSGANVIYQDSKGYLNSNLRLEDISGLEVQSGKLELALGSTFLGDDARLQIDSGAQLNLKNMDDTLSVGDFTGGGLLILDQTQQVSILGQVRGVTKIAVGDVNLSGTNSNTIPKEGHTYLEAKQSKDGDFELLPHSMKPDMQLIRDGQGRWTVGKPVPGQKKILIESISIPKSFTTTDDTYVLIPVTVQYSADSLQGLEYMQFQVKEPASGSYIQAQDNGNGEYLCTINVNGTDLQLSFGTFEVSGQNTECLSIQQSANNSIPSGDYELSILIPKKYMKDGSQDRILSTIITVPNSTHPTPNPQNKIPRPTAQTGLVYNGQKQTGVATGNGYTLSGHENTEAGKYQATATLSSGFAWDDGGTDPVTISWEIAPAPLTIDSATLEPKTYDGSKTASVTNVTLSGMVAGEILKFNTDYTASAEFSDPNVGTGKTADVTVTLAGHVKNYTLKDSVLRLTNQTITPQSGAPAPTVSGSYTASTKYPNRFVYTVDSIQGAEYKMDSGNWQDDNTFDDIVPLSTHIFSARIKETSNQAAGAEGTSAPVLFKRLDQTNVPSLTVALSGDSGNRTITITEVQGAEYSFDGGKSYGANNRKDGCTGTVEVAIRYKETATHNASQPAKQSVNTDKQSQDVLSIDAVGNKTYGDASFTLTTSGGSGNGALRFVSSNSEVLGIDGHTVTIRKAGDVTITAIKEADADYNAASATLDLTIAKKALTVKANNQSVAVGAAMPELTFEVQGLVQGDTFTNPMITTTAKDTTTPGTFDIMISGGTLTHAESYAVTYEGAVLTVSKEMYALTVTNGSGSGTYPAGQSVTITADTRSGYEFTEWTGDAGVVFADRTARTTTLTMLDRAVSVAANYKAIHGNSGSSGSSSGSGSGSSDKTEVSKNPDGSTTETVKKPNGTTIEKTKHPDGSKTVVETQKDGTITTIKTTKDGDRTETVTKKDGSSLTHIKQKDGAASVVAINASGKLDAQVHLSEKSIEQKNAARALVLPMPQVSVPKDASKAPTIQVTTEKEQQVTVMIPVAQENPGVVAVLVDADGTQRVLPKSLMDDAGVRVVLQTPATVRLVDQSKRFVDVPPTHWASDSITFVTAREIYGGVSQDLFEPETNMTRGMLVKVLYNLENQPKTVGNKQFADVHPNAWYADAVRWATEKGIVSGASQDQFAPNQIITREQLAVILHRYLDQPKAESRGLYFQDAGQISGYAQEALSWAVGLGIIQGEEENILNPKGKLNRAECAAILMRCMQTQ